MLKTNINSILRGTNRPGMDKLIDYMESAGFYTSPCSTQHHLAKEGGLAEHSMNVYTLATHLNRTLDAGLPAESVAICSLLHDLGKCGQFGKPGYVPNMLKGRATKANPNPVPVQSTSKPYTSNPDILYVDHEVRSLQIISKYIDLTEEESWAILMHNGLYGSFKYQIQGKETSMYLILHMADMWASRIIEKEEEYDGEA